MSTRVLQKLRIIALVFLLLFVGPSAGAHAEDPGAGLMTIGVLGSPEALRASVEAAVLRNGNVRLASIQDRNVALQEIAFDQSGMTSSAQMKQAGRVLSADRLLIVYQKEQFIAARLVHAETGRVEGALIDPQGRSLRDFSALESALQQMLNGRVVVESLSRLAPGGNQIKVQIRNVQSRLRVGQKLEFEVISDRDGYLTLFNIQPDGVYLPLVPNRFGLPREIRAGRPYSFPGPALSFTVAPPTGVDVIHAVVTERPFTIPDSAIVMNEGYYAFRPETGVETTRGFRLELNALPPGAWGAARVEIETYE